MMKEPMTLNFSRKSEFHSQIVAKILSLSEWRKKRGEGEVLRVRGDLESARDGLVAEGLVLALPRAGVGNPANWWVGRKPESQLKENGRRRSSTSVGDAFVVRSCDRVTTRATQPLTQQRGAPSGAFRGVFDDALNFGAARAAMAMRTDDFATPVKLRDVQYDELVCHIGSGWWLFVP